jgi:hypothetical protein
VSEASMIWISSESPGGGMRVRAVRQMRMGIRT